MALIDDISKDLINAQKQKDASRVSVLRGLKAAMQNEAIAAKKDALSEPELQMVIGKELKKVKDSLAEFTKAARDDLVQKTQTEFDILQAYQPKQLSAEELKALVVKACQQANAQGPADMGKVMKTIMPKVAGHADGKMVSNMVATHLKG